jgi:nitrite reductase/ring-hydroxylating ferredoxin subunit
MDLPVSVTALGEQLRGAGEISPDPALFNDPNVFAAERERIFLRPFVAADHQTRLSRPGNFFRFDAAPRSIIVTRDGDGGLHALRNVCIHAGYPVCDAEEGAAERLICPYHGWEFALDGRLVEPELSSRIDPSRLRMARYPVFIRNGLIFVDPSGKADADGLGASSLPDWLAVARVTRRERHSTTWNWKFLRHFVRSSPDLLFDGGCDDSIEFGPMSFLVVQSAQAVLLRIIPKFAEQTDCHVIELAAEGTACSPASTAFAEGLRCAGASAFKFDRRSADWYWSLMSADG